MVGAQDGAEFAPHQVFGQGYQAVGVGGFCQCSVGDGNTLHGLARFHVHRQHTVVFIAVRDDEQCDVAHAQFLIITAAGGLLGSVGAFKSRCQHIYAMFQRREHAHHVVLLERHCALHGYLMR